MKLGLHLIIFVHYWDRLFYRRGALLITQPTVSRHRSAYGHNYISILSLPCKHTNSYYIKPTNWKTLNHTVLRRHCYRNSAGSGPSAILPNRQFYTPFPVQCEQFALRDEQDLSDNQQMLHLHHWSTVAHRSKTAQITTSYYHKQTIPFNPN